MHEYTYSIQLLPAGPGTHAEDQGFAGPPGNLWLELGRIKECPFLAQDSLRYECWEAVILEDGLEK